MFTFLLFCSLCGTFYRIIIIYDVEQRDPGTVSLSVTCSLRGEFTTLRKDKTLRGRDTERERQFERRRQGRETGRGWKMRAIAKQEIE